MKKILSLILVLAFFNGIPLTQATPGFLDANPDAVYACHYLGLTCLYSDETTDAQDADLDDVLIPTTSEDILYVGYAEPFVELTMDVSTSISGYDPILRTLGSDGKYSIDYWDGSTWTPLVIHESLLTEDYHFENDGTEFWSETWEKPSDWVQSSVNSSSDLYFVRLVAIEEYSLGTAAFAAQIGVVYYPESDGDEDGLTDVAEIDLGTDPELADTDSDGIRDGAEVYGATDPLDAEDYLANGEDYYEECTDPFEDTNENFAEKAICLLYEQGIVQGRTITKYEPSRAITRAEFLKVALLNAGLTAVLDEEVEYEDVDSGEWYYPYVTYATRQGYVQGYDDGTFRPDKEITRGEAMVMIMHIAGLSEGEGTASDLDFTDVDSEDWFAWAVSLARDARISEGYEDGTFRPWNDITRAEVAVIARRVWHVYYR